MIHNFFIFTPNQLTQIISFTELVIIIIFTIYILRHLNKSNLDDYPILDNSIYSKIIVLVFSIVGLYMVMSFIVLSLLSHFGI